MSGVIPAPGGGPLAMETAFVASNDESVLFMNFAVNRTDPQPEHEAFIKNILVPHYINQIEALGFADKTATIHLIGKASATGPRDNNQRLSFGRAQAIGASIKKHFDAQKGRGKIAQGVTLVVDAQGRGDQEERDLLGPKVNTIPPKVIEAGSNLYRSVKTSMRVRHIVNDEDEKVLCRQMLKVQLTVTKVPANLLEQKLAELDAKMPPELKAAVKQFLDAVKGAVKAAVEELLKAAEFGAPELFILFKGIDFIVPSDINLVFEFKDSRGRTKQYRFTGAANKIDLNAIEVLCQVLSIIKWLTKLPQGLEELEREVEETGKKLNLTHEQIDKLKQGIDSLKKVAGNAKSAFDAMTAPNSVVRKVLGDAVVDRVVAAVNAGSTAVLGDDQTATEFAPVSFERKGVFDIFRFDRAARTVTQETFGAPTTVALDFAARENQPLLGFQAHVLLERKWTLGLTLKSFEVSNGALIPL